MFSLARIIKDKGLQGEYKEFGNKIKEEYKKKIN